MPPNLIYSNAASMRSIKSEKVKKRPFPLNMIFSNATNVHAKEKKKYRKYEQYYAP